MPNRGYPPGEVANRMGITAQSVRRYCNRFFSKLSAGASPAKGQPRLLTDKDVYKLRQINEWTSQGKTYEEIDELLDTLIVPDDLPAALPPASIEHPAPVQVADGLAILQSLQGTLQAIAGQNEQIAKLTGLTERHTEELTQLTDEIKSQRLRIDIVFIAISAFIAGLIVGLSVWWFGG
jgi:DNA-binding transcriptional MerR regulator